MFCKWIQINSFARCFDFIVDKLNWFLHIFALNRQTVDAAMLAIMRCAHVYQDLSVHRRNVDQNVLFHRNVHQRKPVSIRNVSIHASERVA